MRPAVCDLLCVTCCALLTQVTLEPLRSATQFFMVEEIIPSQLGLVLYT